jgi:hypothetical protein
MDGERLELRQLKVRVFNTNHRYYFSAHRSLSTCSRHLRRFMKAQTVNSDMIIRASIKYTTMGNSEDALKEFNLSDWKRLEKNQPDLIQFVLISSSECERSFSSAKFILKYLKSFSNRFKII